MAENDLGVPTKFSFIHLLEKKRDGKELTHEEVQSFVSQTVSGEAQDCQIGAMLMAIYLNDLTDQETYSLTKCMMESGEVLSWPKEWSHLLVDKHSTGGVGDKISLVLAPALAACGLKVPMISGRGLGHTGGTLDKLESIPGYQIQLNKTQMEDALSKAGCFITGQTPKLVPADMELYKRRDVTGTVPNPGLITGSILSKKAAEGVSSLVMDIKVGKAAFKPTVEEAEVLAHKILRTSELLGLKTRVVLSRMDSVIGYYAGNALEVVESILCMKGKGPEDICCLTEELGSNLLEMSGLVKSVDEGRKMIQKSIQDGSALQHFQDMVIKQGVDPIVASKLCNDPWSVLPKVPESQITRLPAQRSGIVTNMDGLVIANCCRDLGAGRLVSSQSVNPSVGIRLLVKEGDELLSGNPWIEVHHSTVQLPQSIHARLQQAITISDKGSRFNKLPIVIKCI